jgi:soluble lytic murein transglycosylase-like protein
MPCKAKIRAFALSAASLVVHFAHGGLVVTGIMVLVLGFGFYSGRIELPIRNAGAQDIASKSQDIVAEQSDQEPVAVVQEAVPAPLKPELRAVASYLARRYRVSVQAVEPMVAAAQSSGAKANLDPLLILAVMAIESRFNPFAESVMGAQGLMQVIPKYHQDKIEADPTGKNPLLDPHTNIEVGVLVLKESIKRAGSVEGGLQQYNGAPGDPAAPYASKVMAEKQRLEQAARNVASRSTRQSASRA